MPVNSVQIIDDGGADLTSARGLLLDSDGVIIALSTELALGPLEGNAELASTEGQQLFVTIHGFATCIAGAALTPFAYVMGAADGKVVDYVFGAGVHTIGRFCPEPQDGKFPIVGEDGVVVDGDEVRIFIDIHDATGTFEEGA